MDCVCGQQAAHKCGCGKYYCTKKCQTDDWVMHKNFCNLQIPVYQKILAGELLVPNGLGSFNWQKVSGIVGHIEQEHGAAMQEFVSVWATAGDTKIYFNTMTRYRTQITVLLQWERNGEVYAYDPDLFDNKIGKIRRLEQCDVDKLVRIGC